MAVPFPENVGGSGVFGAFKATFLPKPN